VLIAGGGVAALEAMLALRELAGERVAIELLTPGERYDYRPLAILEPFEGASRYSFELARLAAEADATLTHDTLAGVDADAGMAQTSTGAEIRFDFLVLALGAVPRPALAGALHFGGFQDVAAFRGLLVELDRGNLPELTFVLPERAGWPLPLYELALLTSSHLAGAGHPDVGLTIVTHERAPLALFGPAATAAIEQTLTDARIRVLPGRNAVAYDGEELLLARGGSVRTRRVVTLPQLTGARLEGVPHDRDGFVPIDQFGRVRGLWDVFAAGDMTTFPIKQGGLAAQAADVVAEVVAAEAGAPVVPQPFRPVLRGLLLTREGPTFMRHDLRAGEGPESAVSSEALWWPPGKIVGQYLAPVLARSLRYAETAPPAGGVPVHVELTDA